jgi:toxin ParE1/3/4
MRVVHRPLFVDDLTEAYTYLAAQSPRAADRFLDAATALIDLLAAFPEIGRPRPEIGLGLRSFRVRRFRHLIFYRLEPGALVLLRILHGAQNLESVAMD